MPTRDVIAPVEVAVAVPIVMAVVILLQDEAVAIKAVVQAVPPVEEDVVPDSNGVALITTTTVIPAEMLRLMTRVVITVMHILGKCATVIPMGRIFGLDFSRKHKEPLVVVVAMVEDSTLDVEMVAVVTTLTSKITLLMRVSRLP